MIYHLVIYNLVFYKDTGIYLILNVLKIKITKMLNPKEKSKGKVP